MKIIKLALENFQGIKSQTFDIKGDDVDFYGDNATGKTTVFNAITWLLTDKASNGEKSYSPKTYGNDGKELHFLNHSAEVTLKLGSGRLLTLKKVLLEKYKKKRGQANEDFDGNTCEYYIDAIPSKEKEYLEAVSNYIGSEEVIKVLMMQNYFCEVMSWEARRKLLLGVCGDISDEEVLDNAKDLARLKEILIIPGTNERYAIDDFKAIAKARISKINKELNEIPSRIDEAKKAIQDIQPADKASLQQELNIINEKIQKKQEEKNSFLSQDSASSEINAQIANIKLQMTESKTAYIKKMNDLNSDINDGINDLITRQADTNNNINSVKSNLNGLRRQSGDLELLRGKLHSEYKEVASKNFEGDTHCPTCRQALPSEEIEKAKETFNLNKSKKLEEINTKGQAECSKEKLSKIQEDICEQEKVLASLEQTIEFYNKEIAVKRALLVHSEPFEQSKEYQELLLKINKLELDKADSTNFINEKIKFIDSDIKIYTQKASEILEQISKTEMFEQQNKRIDELLEAEKQFSEQGEEAQQSIFLCEEFIRAKVSMLDEKINNKFTNVRFRLFKEQINGGLKEDCEVMIPTENALVPYSSANSAAKINAGLEIIDTLCDYYDTQMPVFIDNAESISRPIEIRSQVIRLVVSENDKVLRMENGKKDLEKAI